MERDWEKGGWDCGGHPAGEREREREREYNDNIRFKDQREEEEKAIDKKQDKKIFPPPSR